jgi:hypothetical protein
MGRAYLVQFDQDNSVNSNTASSYPLTRYAADNWIGHAGWDRADDRDDLHGLITTHKFCLLQLEAALPSAQVAEQSEADPLYLMAETGFERHANTFAERIGRE